MNLHLAVVLVSDGEVDVFRTPLAALDYFEADYDSDRDHAFVQQDGTVRGFSGGEFGVRKPSTALSGWMIRFLERSGVENVSTGTLGDLAANTIRVRERAPVSRVVRLRLDMAVRSGVSWVTANARRETLLIASAADPWTQVAHVRGRAILRSSSFPLEEGHYVLTCLGGGCDGSAEFLVDGEGGQVLLDVPLTLSG